MTYLDKLLRSSWPDLFRPSTSFFCVANKTWMPATQASEATPFFERLCAGMTLLFILTCSSA
jgi:hypothetical protein